MSRFDTIELSRLPAPAVIEKLDFETLFGGFRAAFEGLMPDYDVGALETDLAMIAGQAFGYQRLLDRARVNDAARSVMLAFARGSDLDQLAAHYNVARVVLTPATGTTPAVMEDDTRFRARVQLAPEALATTGTRGAYIFHALAADPSISDVGLIVPRPGEVHVIVMAGQTGEPSSATVDSVRARLTRDDIKPLTDAVVVRPVGVVPYSVAATLEIARGPDPALIRQQAETSLRIYAASRQRVGAFVPVSGLHAALSVAGVQRVRLQQWSKDLTVGLDQAPRLGTIEISTELVE
ncbi:baseplate assembly protein [Kaistia granuli]|uniref:baseplate assembly protein n=1 Tax=Kaistia granuli TaxID=363259 RepID=UPI000360C53D|nr:baseplate J/gp47 family protein [Kaistia granuli]